MNAGRVPRRRFLFFSLGSQGVQSVNPFEKNVFSQRKVHLPSDTFIFPAKIACLLRKRFQNAIAHRKLHFPIEKLPIDARSRLYQSRLLRVNIHVAAFVNVYKKIKPPTKLHVREIAKRVLDIQRFSIFKRY